jgi:hypothetical protein
MAVHSATLEIESTGQLAHYLAEGAESAPGEIAGSTTLTIEVADFEEALELVETLNRSRAQRKRERKTPEQTSSSASAAPSAPPAVASVAAGDGATPAPEGARRAREIATKASTGGTA